MKPSFRLILPRNFIVGSQISKLQRKFTSGISPDPAQELPPINEFSDSILPEISRRIRLKPRITIKDKKRAGVLIPLCNSSIGPSILFTLRSNSVSTHKGQVSFPGGMLEASDKDVVDCALRETEEEIGLKKERVQVLGQLSDVISVTNVAVTPVVGFIGNLELKELAPNLSEIDHPFLVSLKDLSDPSKIRFETYPRGVLPVFTASEHPIWGLTAYILHNFLKNVLNQKIPDSTVKK